MQSLSASKFRSQIEYAAKQTDLNTAKSIIEDAGSKRWLNECEHPVDITATISDLGVTRLMQVKCGKCDHCKSTRINEWVTRMCLETKYNSKYAYFVTLTYRPYRKFEDIPALLYDAFWHYDDFNSNHKPCWSPCVIRIEHMQKFFRNLRHDLAASGRGDADVRYFLAGEFGSNYARPHYHAVIWSKSPIYKEDVEKAWSIRSGRKDMTFVPIGNVDFHNLNENGTIVRDASIDIHGTKYTANKAFSYVAKYLIKPDSFNKSRLQYLIEQIRKWDKIAPKYAKMLELVFNERMIKKIVEDMYDYTYIESVEPIVKLLNKQPHEAIKKMAQWSVYDLCNENLTNFEETQHKVSHDRFFDLFKPFTSCSRATGIGVVYYQLNAERMVAGNTRISEEEFGELVFPSYYFRKIKESLCGVEFHSRDSNSSSYSKGVRPYLLADLHELLQTETCSNAVHNSRVASLPDLCSSSEELNYLLRSPLSFRDCNTGRRMLIGKENKQMFVFSYSYSKSLRTYVFEHKDTLYNWLKDFEDKCTRSAEFSLALLQKHDCERNDMIFAEQLANQILQEFECYKPDKDCYEFWQMSNPYRQLRSDYIRTQNELRKFRNDENKEKYNTNEL